MQMAPTFSKLERSPAYRRVADVVEEMIGSGRLAAGDVLPTEAELCAQLGVNRSTVREGLRGLEHSGFVKREGKRLRVALPHYGELASRASRAMAMHQVTFRELWEASVALETSTASFAAQRIGSRGIRALEENVKEMRARINDIESVVSLDIEFHNIISEAAGNQALSLAREPISLLFFPAGRVILSRLHTQERVLEAHNRILGFLRKHDSESARVWMERHVDDIKRGYEHAGLRLDRSVDSAMDELSAVAKLPSKAARGKQSRLETREQEKVELSTEENSDEEVPVAKEKTATLREAEAVSNVAGRRRHK
jgi:DNA-binding FadR family transcriptional regulator